MIPSCEKLAEDEQLIILDEKICHFCSILHRCPEKNKYPFKFEEKLNFHQGTQKAESAMAFGL